MEWEIVKVKDVDTKGRVLITGLPGIGNVGKIVTDFLIEETKAEEIAEFYSYRMPQVVYVTEDNLIERPRIQLFSHKNLLILTGDAQPVDEVGTHTLCETLLEFVDGPEIITLGGIGLDELPEEPKLFITGNNKKIIEKYKREDISNEIHGVVGPIMGISGVLLGLAKKQDVPAACLLAETYGHPMHVGLKGARKILQYIQQQFSLDIKLENLDGEIKEFEEKMKIAEDIEKSTGKQPDIHYIG